MAKAARYSRAEIKTSLEQVSLVLLALFFVAFPLLFTTVTTEPYVLPKQVLMGVTMLVLLLIVGARMINESAMRLRRTPFDIPLVLLAVSALLSSFFAVNRSDAFIAVVPFLFAILGYFLIVNIITAESSLLVVVAALVVGATATGVIGILSFFELFVLPLTLTKMTTFTPFGSLLDHSVYMALVLPVAAYFFFHFYRGRDAKSRLLSLFFALSTMVLGLSFATSLYQLAMVQKPTLLPFSTGFQTAFAAISQDAQRLVPAILFGSGFGTFVTDFTRFKQATFNLHPTLWSFTFFRSSSFVLELLATTGLAGFASFVFLVSRILRQVLSSTWLRQVPSGAGLRPITNPLALPLLLAIVTSMLLPFSATLQTGFLLVLALFAALAASDAAFAATKPTLRASNFFDVEMHLVTLKKGLVAFAKSNASGERVSTILPVTFLIVSLVVSGMSSFFIVRYVLSDLAFQRSLVAAVKNSGLETYNNQVSAISLFPWRDAYHRIFSQTNLALANALISSLPKDASPSAQTQTTVITLIRQSIESAQRATTISPFTSFNWSHRSSIYRSLIGFGNNAEGFALSSGQTAIALDPNNPQGYISLGGLYLQLRQWDNAQRQFQIAISLKPDFANAYYNLGHALEAKGNLQLALAQYQTVKSLVGSDARNLKKITEEIEAVEKTIGGTESNSASASEAASPSAKAKAESDSAKAKVPSTTKEQPALEMSTPSATLPQREPKVDIP